MAARTFHLIRSTSDTNALCGIALNTNRDTNWTVNVDDASCKRCLKKADSIGRAAFKPAKHKTPLRHFIESAAPRKTRAACGVKIKTETDTDYTVQRTGVTCPDCLIAMKPKRKKDKPALKRLKKIKKHAEKYLMHVTDAGTGTREAPSDEQSVRIKLAEDLCNVIDAMVTREEEGWLKE